MSIDQTGRDEVELKGLRPKRQDANGSRCQQLEDGGRLIFVGLREGLFHEDCGRRDVSVSLIGINLKPHLAHPGWVFQDSWILRLHLLHGAPAQEM